MALALRRSRFVQFMGSLGLVALTLAIGVAKDEGVYETSSPPTTTTQTWRFNAEGNNAPEEMLNPFGTPGFMQVEVPPGADTVHWVADYQGRSGVWVLDSSAPGSEASMKFSVPNDPVTLGKKTLKITMVFYGDSPATTVGIMSSPLPPYQWAGAQVTDIADGWHIHVHNYVGFCSPKEEVTVGPTSGEICALDRVSIETSCEEIIHDVPVLAAGVTNGCGPPAAASCMKWFQMHDYPNIQTRDGGQSLEDFRNQLRMDARTDLKRGTCILDLWKAILRLVNEGANGQPGPYVNMFKVTQPTTSQLGNFDFLEGEYVKGEDLILLLNPPAVPGQPMPIGHFITVHTMKRSGNQLILTFMDPGDGMLREVTVSIVMNADGTTRLQFPYALFGFGTAIITNAIAVSPNHFTESRQEANPGGGVRLIYTPYYPASSPMKDLHIRIFDSNQNHYQVLGLPFGWMWEIRTEGNKHFLVIYQSDSRNELIPPGAEITVIYTGPNQVKSLYRVVQQSLDGGRNSPSADTKS